MGDPGKGEERDRGSAFPKQRVDASEPRAGKHGSRCEVARESEGEGGGEGRGGGRRRWARRVLLHARDSGTARDQLRNAWTKGVSVRQGQCQPAVLRCCRERAGDAGDAGETQEAQRRRDADSVVRDGWGPRQTMEETNTKTGENTRVGKDGSSEKETKECTSRPRG